MRQSQFLRDLQQSIGDTTVSQYTRQIHDLVRDKVGQDNQPVTAMSGDWRSTGNLLTHKYSVS